jgi:hypothetical protein
MPFPFTHQLDGMESIITKFKLLKDLISLHKYKLSHVLQERA